MTCRTNAPLKGKVALVTGGGSGTGYEVAKSLANRGARVIIASRNATNLELAREEIRRTSGNPDVDYRVFDLASLRSVRHLAQNLSDEPRLDMLINSAGDIGLREVHTEDGLNHMMQVNFFGHFLLTYLLLPKLKLSAPSRILNTVATSITFGDIDFDHWNDINRYNFLDAHANAKLAVFAATNEWARRLNGTGVTANSVDPVIVQDTDTADRFSEQISAKLNKVFQYLWESDIVKYMWNSFYYMISRPKARVAQEIAYIATAPEFENITGELFVNCTIFKHVVPLHKVTYDLESSKIFWEETKKLVKITPEEDWETKLTS